VVQGQLPDAHEAPRCAYKPPLYGFLHRLGYPFVLVSFLFVPLAGLVVWVGVALALLVEGAWIQVLSLFTLILTMQFLLSALALEIDGIEGRGLILYSPLSVLVYKQLMDIFVVKALFDVLFRRGRLSWTRPTRIGMPLVHR